jgi:hypothetical protein
VYSSIHAVNFINQTQGITNMMKLGTQTGSLVNHIYSRTSNPEDIVVGMGATICLWSDRHAVTIVEIGKGYLVTQADTVTRIDKNGMSESQEYEYTPNPNGSLEYWKLDKNGKYRQAHKNQNGRLVFNNHSSHLGIGYREEYYDFSF